MKNRLLVLVVLCCIVVSGAVGNAYAFDLNGTECKSLESGCHYFNGSDAFTGSRCEWMSATTNADDSQLFTHEPWINHDSWRSGTGLVYLSISATLPSQDNLSFACHAQLASPGGDGIGLSLLAKEGNKIVLIKRQMIPADGKGYEFQADISKFKGQNAELYLQVDSNGTIYGDTTVIDKFRITSGENIILTTSKIRQQSRAAFVMDWDLHVMNLETRRPKDDSLMRWNLNGRQHSQNVYSARDGLRPQIGAHIYLTPRVLANIDGLKDIFDFVAHDAGTPGREALELSGTPWIEVFHNGVPLGSWDAGRWWVRSFGDYMGSIAHVYKYMLGICSGSEPHMSPDYYYTGHTKEEVDSLIYSPQSSKDFGQWMADLYGDVSPCIDSNGDGLTFAGDFSFSSDRWETLGTAMPKDGKYQDFLSTLFKEHIISQDVAGIDQAFHGSKNDSPLITTSRLLSVQYPSTFGQSLRQLKYPKDAAGVTYYTQSSEAKDPEGTQATFAPSRIYQSEKKYTTSLEIRPPFHLTSGKCLGTFGPYQGYNRFTTIAKSGFSDAEATLVVRIEQIESDQTSNNGKVLKKVEAEINAGENKSIDMDIAPSTTAFNIRITCWAKNPEKASMNTKVYLLDPALHAGNKQRDMVGDYERAKCCYALDNKPENLVDMGHAVIKYDPVQTEFRGSLIYQQGLRHGARPVYNEFNPGSCFGNTPANVYRSIFHELQYKPADINWFCYGGGQPEATFASMDIHYLSTELAVLRGQLELMSPYKNINRPKRSIGVFLPVANPATAGQMQDAGLLGRQLMHYGPDVLLTEQLDKYAAYDNLVIVLGFIDHTTDAYLTKLLKNPPANKKIIVVCASSQLYCEPGRRASRDFTHSMQDVLPVSPMGGDMRQLAYDIGQNHKLTLKLSNTVWQNPKVSNGQWLKAEGKLIGWKSRNVMVLAGMPTNGFEELSSQFFGLPVPDMRSAGQLHILNRNSVANKPGYYCLDEGQKLQINNRLAAYDVVRRKPVYGVVQKSGVVWVLQPDKLQVLDAGTAQVQLLDKKDSCTVLNIRMPKYHFEGGVKPELIIASPIKPSVEVNGKRLPVVKYGREPFYRCEIAKDGKYTVSSGGHTSLGKTQRQ